MNGIYLRRRGKLYVKPGEGGAGTAEVAMVQKETEALGYVLSEAVVERLGTLSIEQLTQVLRELRKHLAPMTGAHRKHRPLFPDFPKGSLALGEAELYLRAVHHYLTHRRVHLHEPMETTPLLHGREPREIDLGSAEDFETICTRLAKAPTSLSEQDKTDLLWFIKQYQAQVFRLLPEQIPFKENLAVIGAGLLRYAPGAATDTFVATRFKTATDLLRLAVALNDGDVSLAEPTRFKAMKRSERRRLLDGLEACGDPTEDMRRWRERWKRLGEVLHPGDYRERCPNTWRAFQVLREDLSFESFNSAIERDLEQGRTDAVAQRLRARPGELARRLDHLLRGDAPAQAVLDHFRNVAERVSTPVLLQALSQFEHRGESALRTFFPKGDAARAWTMHDRRAPIDATVLAGVIAICRDALRARFVQRAPLGRCYIDPALADMRVPLAQRSASRALRTLVRGSRLPLPDTRFIRLFLWWTNGRNRTDIDLSAAFFDRDFVFRDVVAYYNLKGYGGHHSGDIVDAPRGAAEFIDLDLVRLRELGLRFVVVSIHSFTNQPYCDLPECFAGWMARRDANSGEPFEARTVEDRLDLASNQQSCLPFVLDLQTNQILWTDIGLGGFPRWNNAANHLSGISLILRAMTALATPDLRTLFELHAQARGELVDSPEQADTVFSMSEGITPFDVDRIRADFL
ncbi:TerD family protein [Lysobacter capsici]|uniref:TerD family protein n=1 Tax=Lysobacter capsici TaxID=435897 RepID=UPI001C008D94|nr:TerD family protein [Lysobacter capsici]QWF14904.1 TerD family protein [Lysobacter capsici]